LNQAASFVVNANQSVIVIGGKSSRSQRQGQAHILSTAVVSTVLRLRTWFSIDPQPASINPTINISIVFICAFLADSGRIICHPAIKNDYGANLCIETIRRAA